MENINSIKNKTIRNLSTCSLRLQTAIRTIKWKAKIAYSTGLFVCLLIIPGFFVSIPGIEGTFEYAFDAPWRMEPSINSNGGTEYGRIPIQISIHDAMFSDSDNYPLGVPSMFGEFRHLIIKEPGFSAIKYNLTDLDEIEMTKGVWVWPTGGGPPEHSICRLWAGDDPEPFRNIPQTSEWHALLWYEPQQQPVPGSELPLTIEMEVEQPYPGGKIILRNHVQIYFGDEPLPRFDNKWLYGDLHYHSQGTDNDGESAYNYRGVIRAMGALGIDFVFATEHASNSEQIVDADVDIEAEIDATPIIVSKTSTGGVLRDMSPERFAFNHGLIWGDKGVNKEAAYTAFNKRLPQGTLSHDVVPQIFLGGELDVIPETNRLGLISYGNGLQYNFQQLGGGWIQELDGVGPVDISQLMKKVGRDYLFRDVQGINEFGYGREHMVYFPKNSMPSMINDKGEQITPFISSSTGLYGGASRRLTDYHPKSIRWPRFLGKDLRAKPILPEIEGKGYAFLAHHMNAPSGSAGPNGPPWTLSMLEKAWQSSAILGLEFWNENNRFELEISDLSNWTNGGQEIGYERCEGVGWHLWEDIGRIMLCEPFPNNTVRDAFKQDQRLFELIPYNVADGSSEVETKVVDHMLHHGAASWDEINRWGLDLSRTRNLDWLERRAPRRFFMAGGSDAHGDFNYRRTGYFLGTTAITSTVIGQPRNLVFAGNPLGEDKEIVHQQSLPGQTQTGPLQTQTLRRHTHEQIIEALKNGYYSITDGPALRIAIDRNRNNEIDTSDIPMGAVFQMDMLYEAKIRLLIEWKSTPEFGPIEKIDLYVGTQTSQQINNPDDTRARTYAPQSHGTRDEFSDPPSEPQGSYSSSNGISYTKMADGYWLDPSSNLRYLPDAKSPESYNDVVLIELDLKQFEAAMRVAGDRFYIRAFAMTAPANGVSRYAFTNPIWIIDRERVLRR